MVQKKATNEKCVECMPYQCKQKSTVNCNNGLYGLGVIGAGFYFLSQAANSSEVLVGIFKAIFWPAIFVYQVLSFWQL